MHDVTQVSIIKDSVSSVDGTRLITAEWIYPRFIHSEVMTHSMLAKNAASSRAIPVDRQLKMIMETPAMPASWGTNNPGMQSKNPMNPDTEKDAIATWLKARDAAVTFSQILGDKDGINAHKQIANRLTEPFVMMKIVVTATHWQNMLFLRDHLAADPTFHQLARKFGAQMRVSKPTVLDPGEWHLPYVQFLKETGEYIVNGEVLPLELAKIVSTSCCAQVSYRTLNDTVDKAVDIFEKLSLNSETDPKHASPTEHQATPMKATHRPSWLPMFKPSVNIPEDVLTWEEGITHMRRDHSLWSGRFKSWIQHRQLIKNEAVWE